MVRISGVTLPDNKKVCVGLSYLYGVGVSLAKKICEATGVDVKKRIKDLTDDEVEKVRLYISSNCTVEGDLRALVSQNIKLKIAIKCYQGVRHFQKLPVHGQRTKTNARTRKGRGMAVANKKVVAK